MPMRRWQDEQNVDRAATAEALDCRIPLRMQFSLDLFEAPDAHFDFAQDNGRPREEAGVDGATTRKREFELGPPATPNQPHESVDDSRVPGVVDQGGSFPVELHPEVRSQGRTGSRSDNGAHPRVASLETGDHRAVDADRVGNRSLRHADAQSELAEVLGEAERGAAQLTITLHGHRASYARLVGLRHGAHRTADGPYPGLIACLRP